MSQSKHKASDLITAKGLLLLSLNIKSLLSKVDCLRIDLVNVSFDFLALCETWLNPTISDGLLKIGDYCLVRADRNLRNRSGDLKA